MTITRIPALRVSRDNPCPICGKPDWCQIIDRTRIRCMRVQSDKPCNDGGGWWHTLGSYSGVDNTVYRHYPDPENNTQAVQTTPEQRHAVYSALLELCPLSPRDRHYLLSCGVPAGELTGYGTLPRDRQTILRKLSERFDSAIIYGVPGFFKRKSGGMELAGMPGLIISISTRHRQIFGIQIRSQEENGSKVYRWLSSANHSGPASGSPAHVISRGDGHVVWITEGAKKAHVMSAKTGCTAIGLPGHASQESGLQALAELQDAGALAVVIALDEDADPATAALVELSRQRLVVACLARGLAVRIARWDAAVAKGIDDLLMAEHEPRLEVVSALLKPEDAGSRAGGRKLTTIEEGVRYRALRRLYYASMSPAEKVALWSCWEQTDLYPGTIASGGSVDAVPVNIGYLADRVGVSRGVAGRTVQHLAEVGLITRHESSDPLTQHKVISVAPARALAFNETLPKAEYKRSDAARKRCKACGSERGFLAWHCLDCGLIDESVSCLDSEHGPDREPPCSESAHITLSIETDRPCSDSHHDPSKEKFMSIVDCAESEPGGEFPSPAEIIAQIEQAGVRLALSDVFPLKVLASPRSAITAAIAATIREWRDEIVDVLYERQADSGVSWWERTEPEPARVDADLARCHTEWLPGHSTGQAAEPHGIGMEQKEHTCALLLHL